MLKTGDPRCSESRRAHPPARLVVATLMGLAGASSCAHVDPAADFARTRQLIRSRTGAETAYDPDAPVLTHEEIDALLVDGLTLEEAVRLALLNNRGLQAEFMRIGVAKADLVQAGLLSNPTLAFSAQFPEGGGRSNVQASLAQNIADLWQIPLRRKVADAALNETILEAAHVASTLAQQTRIDYYRAKAAEGQHDVAEKNRELVSRSHAAVQSQREAGLANLLDENLAHGQVLTAELGVRQARLEAANAKRELARRLSLSRDVEAVRLVDALADSDEPAPTAEEAIEIARTHRLDVQAIEQATESLLAGIALEKRRILPDVSIGPFLERPDRRATPGRDVAADFVRSSLTSGALTVPGIQSRSERQRQRSREIDFLMGPALTLTLPIFDQNQAQIARARYEYLREFREYEALLIDIAQNVRLAVDAAITAQSTAAYYRDQLVPQALQSLEFAMASYAAGQTNLLTLLEAQRSALEAQRGRTKTLLEANVARSRLELELGTRLDGAARSSAESNHQSCPGLP